MEEFKKEVEKMTEDDILLALEEQANLYNADEIKILRDEYNKRDIKKCCTRCGKRIEPTDNAIDNMHYECFMETVREKEDICENDTIRSNEEYIKNKNISNKHNNEAIINNGNF